MHSYPAIFNFKCDSASGRHSLCGKLIIFLQRIKEQHADKRSVKNMRSAEISYFHNWAQWYNMIKISAKATIIKCRKIVIHLIKNIFWLKSKHSHQNTRPCYNIWCGIWCIEARFLYFISNRWCSVILLLPLLPLLLLLVGKCKPTESKRITTLQMYHFLLLFYSLQEQFKHSKFMSSSGLWFSNQIMCLFVQLFSLPSTIFFSVFFFFRLV